MSPSDDAALTLAAHFLPPGLLPLKDVECFSVSTEKVISVELSRSGKRIVNGKVVFYSKRITGKLELGKLTNVRGIQVKELLLPVPVSTIQKCGHGLQVVQFYAGPMEERFPLQAFSY